MFNLQANVDGDVKQNSGIFGFKFSGNKKYMYYIGINTIID